jgi:hypothetical protein
MKTEFNRAGSKEISPVAGAAIVIAFIAIALWLKLHA